jgi:hypothetical protein
VLITALEAPRGEEVEHDDLTLEIGQRRALRSIEAGQVEVRGTLTKERAVDQARIGPEPAGEDDCQHDGYPDHPQTHPSQGLSCH